MFNARGYGEHKCEKRIKRTTDQKRCNSCKKKDRLEKRRKAVQKYKKTIKGRERNRDARRRYCKTLKGRKMRRVANSKYNKSVKGHITGNKGNWHFRKVIGITPEIWTRDSKKGCMFKFLGNCAGKLCADHDHETNYYRGPLCIRHNLTLGALGDSPKTLKLVAEVLEAAHASNLEQRK